MSWVQTREMRGKPSRHAGAKRRSWHGSQVRGDNHGPDNAVLERAVKPEPLEFHKIQKRKQLLEAL